MRKLSMVVASMVLVIGGWLAYGLSPEAADIAAIQKLEDDQVKADRSGDVSYYESNLTDDYTAGTSWGTWYTKQTFLNDLHDASNNKSYTSTISNMKIRVYGNAGIATYDQSYDALIQGQRQHRQVINTDVFVKKNDRWLMAAQHTSAVKNMQ